MKIVLFLVIFALPLTVVSQEAGRYVSVKKELELMGTQFGITMVAETSEEANTHISEAIAEIKRIEELISSWDPGSETSQINRSAGVRPVRVSLELFELIARAKKLSEITDGAFDISYASMDRVWQFDGTMTNFPPEDAIKRSIAKIGHQKVVLDKASQTVFLSEKGMKIGFGGIGKGYAADKVKQLMLQKKVPGGVINASGDLTTWGTKATKESWRVGITHPEDKSKIYSWMPVVESSVATSGNYERFFMYKGQRYSHIIDPRTGYPTSGIKSVTIFAKSAELCDALATSVFVMGRDSGIHLIDQLKGVEVVLIDDDNKVHKSAGIALEDDTGGW